MAPKGDVHRDYSLHGDSVESMRAGFESIAMPPHRWEYALAVIRDVTEANSVTAFRWYRVPGKDELPCYWDDAEKNLLWVWANNVHTALIGGEPLIVMPERPVDYRTDEALIRRGWLLPGGNTGVGGGRRHPKSATVKCPHSFIDVPAGAECSHCGETHVLPDS